MKVGKEDLRYNVGPAASTALGREERSKKERAHDLGRNEMKVKQCLNNKMRNSAAFKQEKLKKHRLG
jgi:hypothetical protein